MGCWGMGIAQSDEFCEVYEQFMESYDEGKPVQEITQKILDDYHKEFPHDDGIMHDVYFALAKAEWMCCALSSVVLDKVKDIIDSGSNLLFYSELGAKESDLKIRKKNLDKFWTMLQTPRATPRQRKPKPKYVAVEAKKGMVFWYRSKGTVYGALILDVLGKNSILVALSDALESVPKSVETVLNANVYTASWFGALLPPKRVHEIGMIDISGNYNGRAGMYHTDEVHFCENFGMDYQWDHERCALKCHDMKMRDLLNSENLPASFRNQDRLNTILQSKGRIIWIMG